MNYQSAYLITLVVTFLGREFSKGKSKSGALDPRYILAMAVLLLFYTLMNDVNSEVANGLATVVAVTAALVYGPIVFNKIKGTL